MYEWKSSTKHKTLAPIYEEKFTFQVTKDMKVSLETGSISLTLYVMDFDYLSQDDTIGVIEIGKEVQSASGRAHWTRMLGSPCQQTSSWHPILSCNNV